eukprot:1846683-Prymnesium_polylepis.1
MRGAQVGAGGMRRAPTHPTTPALGTRSVRMRGDASPPDGDVRGGAARSNGASRVGRAAHSGSGRSYLHRARAPAREMRNLSHSCRGTHAPSQPRRRPCTAAAEARKSAARCCVRCGPRSTRHRPSR